MIYIVRHGQTDGNVQKIYQGRQDTELNKTGIRQAKTIKEKLKDIQFDFVISSPLKRALQTAQIITDNPIITDERIIERCNGEWEGKLVAECPNDYDFNDPYDNRYGIENITDFKRRITDFLEELQTRFCNQDILVVTHAGVILYIREYFEGAPKDNDYSNYKLQNCQVITYNNR